MVWRGKTLPPRRKSFYFLFLRPWQPRNWMELLPVSTRHLNWLSPSLARHWHPFAPFHWGMYNNKKSTSAASSSPPIYFIHSLSRGTILHKTRASFISDTPYTAPLADCPRCLNRTYSGLSYRSEAAFVLHAISIHEALMRWGRG